MKYMLSPGTILTSVCDSYFLVFPGRSIRINETTAFYVKQLEKGADKKDLIKAVAETYELENEEETIKGIEELLNFLKSNRLLTRCE